MLIGVPVECQNGHKRLAYIRIDGLEATYEGVPSDKSCKCPKWEIGQGWRPVG